MGTLSEWSAASGRCGGIIISSVVVVVIVVIIIIIDVIIIVVIIIVVIVIIIIMQEMYINMHPHEAWSSFPHPPPPIPLAS
jgi:hypothetical protein